MNIAEIAIEKNVITYTMMVLLLVGGVLGFRNIGKLEDPDFTIRDVMVITPYPGASPREVEEEVSDVIERAAQQIADVEEVRSESSNDRSTVTVTFREGIPSQEYRQLFDELRRKIGDAQIQLPPGAGPSLVNDDFGDVYGIFYAVTGEGFSQKELSDFARDLEKELLTVPGVNKVALWGIPQEVVYVEISQSQLSNMDIPEDYIFSLLYDQNMVVPTGTVLNDSYRMTFRGEESAQTVLEIGNIVLSSRADSQITLKDIATITRSYEDPPQTVLRFNGQRGIGLGVSTEKGGNVIAIGEAITARLQQILVDTPIGMELRPIMMQGVSVNKAIKGFVVNLVQSVVIVVGLLMIFMGLRSGLLIGWMLLLIIAGTIFIMYLQDITLQRISLGALIIAMGMLVDNSIVVTEGMVVRFERGEKKLAVAKAVIKQQIWPLFGATVVAIFAFAAVGLSPDSTGEYTRSLFQVIIISLMMSWFLAITVNPLLAVRFLGIEGSQKKEDQEAKESSFMIFYRRVVKAAIKNKHYVVVLLGALLVLTLVGRNFIAVSFFPKSEQPQFMIDYWLPEGTDLYRTEADMKQIEEYLLGFEEIKQVSTFVGAAPLRFQLTFSPEKANSGYGMFLVEVWDVGTMGRLFPEIQSYLDSNFLDGMSQLLQFNLGPGSKGAVSTRIVGRDSEVIRSISEEIKKIYYEEGGVAIIDDWGSPFPSAQFAVDPLQVQRTGLTRQQVNQALQKSFEGRRVGLFREGDSLIPIIVRPPEEERLRIEQVNDLFIWSPRNGRYIPLAQLSPPPGLVWEDAKIQRKDRLRAMEVKCDPPPGVLANALFRRTRRRIEALELPPGYRLEWAGEYEDSQNANAGISKTFPLAFLAMILTILILWNRLRQPIIIFLSVPLSLVGVVFGLLVTNTSLGFMAILGSLALFGMAIKNGIVMVDEIDLQIREGKGPYQALLDSSESRLRPVMMATLSTVMGMAPLMADIFFRSMAVAVMFGLSLSAFLTLIVTPTLYALFFKIDPPSSS